MIRELFAAIVAALGRRPGKVESAERRDESAPEDPEELRELAALSRQSTRDSVELEPPGQRLTGLTTDDVDMTTGKPYPDYLERRRQRAAAKPEDALIGVVRHDVRPD